MKVEQISIFLENRPGVLEQVTGILKDAGINIRTLTLADTSDFGILRMIVNDVDATSRVLKENGFRVSRTNVVAVESRTVRAASTGSSRRSPEAASTSNTCTPSSSGAARTP
jgi:hypothetical protein